MSELIVGGDVQPPVDVSQCLTHKLHVVVQVVLNMFAHFASRNLKKKKKDLTHENIKVNVNVGKLLYVPILFNTHNEWQSMY